jgi:hypothetical protein
MKKVLVLLLVIGFLVGTFAVIEELYEEHFSNEHTEFTDDSYSGDDGENPTPCGGGNGDSGLPG